MCLQIFAHGKQRYTTLMVSFNCNVRLAWSLNKGLSTKLDDLHVILTEAWKSCQISFPFLWQIESQLSILTYSSSYMLLAI